MQTLQRRNKAPDQGLRPEQVEEFTRLWSAIAAIRRQRHVVLSAILTTLNPDERDRFVALHARVAAGLERTKHELTKRGWHEREERH